MTRPDEIDELKAAFDAATPAPDPERKAAALARARAAHGRRQGSAGPARHTPAATRTGLFQGVIDMLSTLTTRGGLVATTAVFAGCFLMLTPGGRELMRPVLPDGSERMETLAPVPGDAPVTPPADGEVAESLALEGEEMETFRAEPAAPSAIAPPPEPAPLARSAAPVPSGASGEALGGIAGDLDDAVVRPLPDTEAFPEADPSELKVTTETPVSTFSIDVDTAAWSVVRSSLTRGTLPPSGAVRIEEMINYFPYDYAAPEADGPHPFRTHVGVLETPWNSGTELVRIGIQGRMPALEDRPPLNLVFLIDTSGSMDQADKLPLLRQSFRLMLSELRDEDEVAIVTYAGSAGRVLEPTPASDRETILAALDRLSAGGSTNGQGGLQQAYATAEEMFDTGEVGRILLATDGDFNVGLSDPAALESYIAEKRDSGTYLSVLGFGRGNLDDATMQALAQNGNGTAAYIDTLSEAQKVLVDQLSGALFPIADDVKIQVEFNPATIAEYRLIGYETRALRREDFNNDAVDAGELGAGHAVTALYEVTPVGSDARLTDPLRYGAAEAAEAGTDGEAMTEEAEYGFLKLRYKAPGAGESTLIETPIIASAPAGDEARFAAAIAGFGELLRGSDYLGDWGYDEAIALANEARGTDPFGYRTEAVQLMRLAQSLSE